eukprot:633040-Amphidinium_carterae.1
MSSFCGCKYVSAQGGSTFQLKASASHEESLVVRVVHQSDPGCETCPSSDHDHAHSSWIMLGSSSRHLSIVLAFITSVQACSLPVVQTFTHTKPLTPMMMRMHGTMMFGLTAP